MQPLSRYTIVVSDFHLGDGARLPDGRQNPMEDFPYDDKFIDFLRYYSSGAFEKAEVDLVINGDFLNIIQVFAPTEKEPHIITEKKGLERTKIIVEGHKDLFDALSDFAKQPGKRVVFIPGNHDSALLWKAVQDYLAERIGGSVVFLERAYIKNGLYVEHGDRYDPFHVLPAPYTEIIKQPGLEPRLNIPWGTYFFLNIVLPLKRKRPYVDKVLPFRNYLIWAFFNDLWLFLITMARLLVFIIKMLLKRVGMHKFSVLYIISLLKTLTVTPDLSNGAKRIFYKYPEVKMVVFGHTHKATFVPMPGGRSYYNTGCWNQITGMEPGKMGTTTDFTYLVVKHTDKGPKGTLMVWRGYHKPAEEYF